MRSSANKALLAIGVSAPQPERWRSPLEHEGPKPRARVSACVTLTFTDFRKRASGVLSDVEKGEAFVIVRHGRPIAELSPVTFSRSRDLAWRRRGLRLVAPGATLSRAIFDEREKTLLSERHDAERRSQRHVAALAGEEVKFLLVGAYALAAARQRRWPAALCSPMISLSPSTI